MALRLDVRRLAAVDRWGSAGVRWRRWAILVEFLVGVAGMVAPGIVVLLSGSVEGTALGLVFIGVGLNYLPLALYTLAFVRPGPLEAEIEGVDVFAEVRHYTVAQFWVVVPLLPVVLAAGPLRRRGR